MAIIRIRWSRPYDLDSINGLSNSEDYGVYQIYGHHAVYGAGTLLYIGMVEKSSFSTRINQHKDDWFRYNEDQSKIEIYVGRLIGEKTPSANELSKQINNAEKLLIYAHAPVYNTENKTSIPDELEDVHVVNYGNYRSLMPEVSGTAWTKAANKKYLEWSEYK